MCSHIGSGLLWGRMQKRRSGAGEAEQVTTERSVGNPSVQNSCTDQVRINLFFFSRKKLILYNSFNPAFFYLFLLLKCIYAAAHKVRVPSILVICHWALPAGWVQESARASYSDHMNGRNMFFSACAFRLKHVCYMHYHHCREYTILVDFYMNFYWLIEN